ncbi:MAG: GNAT family N-acetyltransferase [Minwuia sp.]|nr:GNAT family N-acetyltransferase [Minwuia sp.]
MPIQIRRAGPADVQALVSCIDAAYARYAATIPDLPAVSEGVAEEIAENLVWIAVDDGQAIGALFLMHQGETMKLANVAVHPAHAGKGLGRRLIALAEAEAAARGCTEMRLNTHAAMPDNVRLYSQLGWVETGRQGNSVSMRKPFGA